MATVGVRMCHVCRRSRQKVGFSAAYDLPGDRLVNNHSVNPPIASGLREDSSRNVTDARNLATNADPTSIRLGGLGHQGHRKEVTDSAQIARYRLKLLQLLCHNPSMMPLIWEKSNGSYNKGSQQSPVRRCLNLNLNVS
jgi:hypothetical protein